MCSASPDDLETRIRQAVDDVLVQATGTFLDIDDDEFTALSYVLTHAVMAEVNRQPTADCLTRTVEDHIYLSTSCQHREHHYCQSSTGLAGAKTPASCKFCHAKCICMCHVAARDLDLTDKNALHAWMGARRDTGKTYPATLEEFAAMQRTRLLAFLTKDDTEDDQPDRTADQ